ncbi:MAG: hypothetical protein NVV74_15805 [Magnetospirillum sp.]|nr:hypothetical protein [Magnetospirillum sp.]
MRSIQEIFDMCVTLKLTTSQGDFSRLWGRAESWFSSALSRQAERRLSTEALLAFYFSLVEAEQHSDGNLDHGRITAIRQLRLEIWSEIAERVRT